MPAREQKKKCQAQRTSCRTCLRMHKALWLWPTTKRKPPNAPLPLPGWSRQTYCTTGTPAIQHLGAQALTSSCPHQTNTQASRYAHSLPKQNLTPRDPDTCASTCPTTTASVQTPIKAQAPRSGDTRRHVVGAKLCKYNSQLGLVVHTHHLGSSSVSHRQPSIRPHARNP